MCLLIKYGEVSDCKYKGDGREREEPRLTVVRTKPNLKRRKEEEEEERTFKIRANPAKRPREQIAKTAELYG